MSDDTAAETGEGVLLDGDAAAKSKGGRPKKSRGAPTSSDSADMRWTIRGVPVNVREMALKAAESQGLTIGDWLAEAIVAKARLPKPGDSADRADVSADRQLITPELKAFLDEHRRLTEATVAQAVAQFSNRLDALENQKNQSLGRRIGRLFRR
jgi:hypothetical protein